MGSPSKAIFIFQGHIGMKCQKIAIITLAKTRTMVEGIENE
jgi:hypothetical protein